MFGNLTEYLVFNQLFGIPKDTRHKRVYPEYLLLANYSAFFRTEYSARPNMKLVSDFAELRQILKEMENLISDDL